MLSLSGVTLSPPFASDKHEYIGNAANSTQLTTVSYTADIGARMVDIRNVVAADVADSAIDDFDGDPSNGHQVHLTKGPATVIYVAVTAENGVVGTAADVYKITIYRDAETSSDATLQTLALSGITLSPAFDPATMAYTRRGSGHRDDHGRSDGDASWRDSRGYWNEDPYCRRERHQRDGNGRRRNYRNLHRNGDRHARPVALANST